MIFGLVDLKRKNLTVFNFDPGHAVIFHCSNGVGGLVESVWLNELFSLHIMCREVFLNHVITSNITKIKG